MAFEEYTVSTGTNGKTPNFVAISVTGRKGDARPKNLTFVAVLGPDVVKACSWTAGDQIAIYFGTGEDKGKALLKKSDVGTTTVLTNYVKKTTPDDNPVALKLQRAIKPVAPINDFVNTVIAKENVAFVWDEAQQGLMVTLPKGFFTESGTASSPTN